MSILAARLSKPLVVSAALVAASLTMSAQFPDRPPGHTPDPDWPAFVEFTRKYFNRK
jgi:hypothetical protein